MTKPTLENIYDGSTQTTNERGEWVPAIPMPLFLAPHSHRKRCECGRTFWRMAAYRGHYALAHILGTP